MEKAFIEFLSGLVTIIGDLADIFVKNQAWGVVAALYVILVALAWFNRKDRLSRDKRMDELLESRNKQIMDAFDKATNMVNVVGDLEDRINVMDMRCDLRQRQRKKKQEPKPEDNKEGQA